VAASGGSAVACRRGVQRTEPKWGSYFVSVAACGCWKVKVERTLRLHSQLTRQRIETLRFASDDEEIQAALYDERACRTRRQS